MKNCNKNEKKKTHFMVSGLERNPGEILKSWTQQKCPNV